jgi:hypothetical protein
MTERKIKPWLRKCRQCSILGDFETLCDAKLAASTWTGPWSARELFNFPKLDHCAEVNVPMFLLWSLFASHVLADTVLSVYSCIITTNTHFKRANSQLTTDCETRICCCNSLCKQNKPCVSHAEKILNNLCFDKKMQPQQCTLLVMHIVVLPTKNLYNNPKS